MTDPLIIQGLREFATYLEGHPEATLIYPSHTIFVGTREALAEIARLNKPIAKVYAGNWFMLSKTFSGGVTLNFTIQREKVCRKVVTKELITRPRTIVVEGETETVETEKVEWVCTEPLLAPELGKSRGLMIDTPEGMIEFVPTADEPIIVPSNEID